MKKFPNGARVMVYAGREMPGTVTEDAHHGLRQVAFDDGVDAWVPVKDLVKPGYNCTVVISVRGGCVQDVEGLPRGWNYLLVDHDNEGR